MAIILAIIASFNFGCAAFNFHFANNTLNLIIACGNIFAGSICGLLAILDKRNA